MTPEELLQTTVSSPSLGQTRAVADWLKDGYRALVKATEVATAVADLKAEVAAIPAIATVTLSTEDREAIILAVSDNVAARLGLIPTAQEIGRAAADEIHARMEA